MECHFGDVAVSSLGLKFLRLFYSHDEDIIARKSGEESMEIKASAPSLPAKTKGVFGEEDVRSVQSLHDGAQPSQSRPFNQDSSLGDLEAQILVRSGQQVAQHGRDVQMSLAVAPTCCALQLLRRSHGALYGVDLLQLMAALSCKVQHFPCCPENLRVPLFGKRTDTFFGDPGRLRQ